VTATAPGRVNLIGEHTDYNGGLALACAIDRRATVTAEASQDNCIEAHAIDFDAVDRFELDNPEPADGWQAFVRGAVSELSQAGYRLVPARLSITADVPQRAGLSSSAAIAIAVSLALLCLAGYPAYDRYKLARLCSCVENRWVGAQTGLLDQLAALFAREGEAVLIDFESEAVTPVPLTLDGWQLAYASSNTTRSNQHSSYNQRRAECDTARRKLGCQTLTQASQAGLLDLQRPLDRRVRHVITENARVRQTVEALRRGDLQAVSQLLNASHASLRDDFEASTPEVEATVTWLIQHGALGARMVGGGFGGSVLALFPPQSELPPACAPVVSGPPARCNGASG
jgi:galactokinase